MGRCGAEKPGMALVSLTKEHDVGLQAFLSEFDAADEGIPAYFAPRDWKIDQIIAQHQREERGEERPIPSSTRFLVEDGTLLGVVNVRHRLNDKLRRFGGHVGYSVRPSARGRGHATAMLRHALELLRGLGEPKTLLTCAEDNHASAAVIHKCGGAEFEREFLEEHDHVVRRFWIEFGRRRADPSPATGLS